MLRLGPDLSPSSQMSEISLDSIKIQEPQSVQLLGPAYHFESSCNSVANFLSILWYISLDWTMRPWLRLIRIGNIPSADLPILSGFGRWDFRGSCFFLIDTARHHASWPIMMWGNDVGYKAHTPLDLRFPGKCWTVRSFSLCSFLNLDSYNACSFSTRKYLLLGKCYSTYQLLSCSFLGLDSYNPIRRLQLLTKYIGHSITSCSFH